MKDLLIYFVSKKDESFIERYVLDEDKYYFYKVEPRKKISVLISKEYRDIQNRGVVFIVLKGKIRAVASYATGTANVTNKKRVSLKNITKLSSPIKMKSLKEGIDKSLMRYIPDTSEEHEVILPVPIKTKEAILSFFKKTYIEIHKEIIRLYELANLGDRIPTFAGAEIFQAEKDTILFTMGLLSTSNKFNVEENLNYSKENENNPFMLLLKSNAVEDDMIYHDASNFGDIESIKKYSNGSFYYQDKDANCGLMITNCNRKKLESTLGVDLVIYNGLFKSYLLIQYKRMSTDSDNEIIVDLSDYDEDEYKTNYGKQFGFRPDSDSNFSKELKKMNNVYKSASKNKVEDPNCIHDWRLGDDFLYFKLCGSLKQKITSGTLVPGMYLPLSYMNKLLKHNTTLGPKGGRILAYNNCPSYISKDIFQDLAKKGIIGSRAIATDLISNYIKKTLEEDRSVVLAEIQLLANNVR